LERVVGRIVVFGTGVGTGVGAGVVVGVGAGVVVFFLFFFVDNVVVFFLAAAAFTGASVVGGEVGAGVATLPPKTGRKGRVAGT